MSGLKIAVRGAAGQALPLDMGGLCAFLSMVFHQRSVAKQVAFATGIPASTCEKWFRGETRISGGHLAALISVFGPPFVAAAMPGAQWAREAVLDAELIDLGTRLEAAIKRRLAA